MDSQSIITNCPLCEEKSLHIIGEDEYQTQQCINCGYATAPRYKLSDDLDKEKCESYMALTEEMKSWSKLSRNYIWIPTILTLPFGLLFPQNNEDGNLHWGFAKLINLTEEEQKNYPIPGSDGTQFYKTKYDTDNSETFKTFLEAMVHVNQQAKPEEPKETDIKLPSLKNANKKRS